MKRIVYFLAPLPNGGVVFQNGYLDDSLKNNSNLTNRTNNMLASQSHPDIKSNGFYLQGGDVSGDLLFYKNSYIQRNSLERAINLINDINKGFINV